jgi:hypothetical protein
MDKIMLVCLVGMVIGIVMKLYATYMLNRGG